MKQRNSGFEMACFGEQCFGFSTRVRNVSPPPTAPAPGLAEHHLSLSLDMKIVQGSFNQPQTKQNVIFSKLDKLSSGTAKKGVAMNKQQSTFKSAVKLGGIG